jgi:nitrogen regulatory protein PII-like uncharacterized protein
MNILAVDPGTKALGWAVMDSINKRCTACGFATTGAWRLVDWDGEYDLDAAVIEVPQVYPQRSWKGDANDLIDVALAAGAVAGSLGCDVRYVRPREWKGTAPKEVHQRRILTLLDMSERAILDGCGAPKSKLHNVVDAVGLGLWSAGRLKR